MSDLRLKLPSRNAPLSEKEAKIQAQFFRKLLLPWLALLAVIGAAPFCVKVTRELNVYFIYAVSIFGLVFIYFLMNGATTLADRQVMDPYIALIVPFAIISSILTARYYGSV
jgi:lipopolysaccharide export system permease protein